MSPPRLTTGLDVPLYPVGLVVAGHPCLVVGGGAIAERKISALLYCQAAVTVVAPEVCTALAILAAQSRPNANQSPPLDVQLRPYQPGEAAGYRLVITATGVRDVDRAVHDDAEAAGVWVNSADDLDNCTFLLPSVHRDGPVTVSVATGGTSPALATWLRRRIATSVGPGLAALAGLLAEARHDLRQRGRSTEHVDWAALLDGPLPDLVRQGRLHDARHLLAHALDATRGLED